MKNFPLLLPSLALSIGIWSEYESCTSFVYKGPDKTIFGEANTRFKESKSFKFLGI